MLPVADSPFGFRARLVLCWRENTHCRRGLSDKLRNGHMEPTEGMCLFVFPLFSFFPASMNREDKNGRNYMGGLRRQRHGTAWSAAQKKFLRPFQKASNVVRLLPWKPRKWVAAALVAIATPLLPPFRQSFMSPPALAKSRLHRNRTKDQPRSSSGFYPVTGALGLYRARRDGMHVDVT